jgi:hypothetical protein
VWRPTGRPAVALRSRLRIRVKGGENKADTMLGGENGCSIDSKRRITIIWFRGWASPHTRPNTPIHTQPKRSPIHEFSISVNNIN